MGRGLSNKRTALREPKPLVRKESKLSASIQRIKALKPGVLPSSEDLIEICSLDHAGIKTSNEIVRVANPTTNEAIEIKSDLVKDGNIVGESTIWVNWDGKEKQYLRFKLSYLRLSEEARGSGLGDYRHEEYERRFRAAGVDRIEIWADEIGSYKWASKGYEFDYEYLAPRPSYMMPGASREEVQARCQVALAKQASDIVQAKESWIQMLVDKGDVPKELVEELQERIIHTSYKDDFETQLKKSEGEISTPAELVEFGKEYSWTNEEGRETWLGKDVMLYSPWRGVKYLNGDPWDLLES